MPIRFACEHCGQRLSVSSRKAGARGKCPKCKEPIQVPQPDDAAVHSATQTADEDAAAAADAEDGYQDPFAQFMVFDDDAELIYVTEEDEAVPAGELAHGPIDPNKVAVPRKILYAQGVLLGVVAIFCFTLGVIVGVSSSSGTAEIDTGPQPCYIYGRLAFRDLDGEIVSDEGAVAIVLPFDVKPETKANLSNLLPGGPMPAEDQPDRQVIQRIGGDYARADADGRYRLRVPDRGQYFLLLISNHQRRDVVDGPKPELAQIGRFFNLSAALFGQNAYTWREETVKRDREINEVFE